MPSLGRSTTLTSNRHSKCYSECYIESINESITRALEWSGIAIQGEESRRRVSTKYWEASSTVSVAEQTAAHARTRALGRGLRIASAAFASNEALPPLAHAVGASNEAFHWSALPAEIRNSRILLAIPESGQIGTGICPRRRAA
jgi:hypothetical protein